MGNYRSVMDIYLHVCTTVHIYIHTCVCMNILVEVLYYTAYSNCVGISHGVTCLFVFSSTWCRCMVQFSLSLSLSLSLLFSPSCSLCHFLWVYIRLYMCSSFVQRAVLSVCFLGASVFMLQIMNFLHSVVYILLKFTKTIWNSNFKWCLHCSVDGSLCVSPR